MRLTVLLAVLCSAPIASGQIGVGDPPPMPIAQPLDTIRFGLTEPEPKPAGALRVVSYNVLNLFDDVDDPSLSGRREDIDDTKPDEQCRSVAQTIKRLDADVLCLQEVESRAALDWFLDTYMPDHGYDHIVSPDAGDERGIEQAVLSRYPIVRTEQWVGEKLGGVHPDLYGDKPNWYAGEPLRYHRSPLLVEVDADGYALTLIVLHHKSGYHSAYWREAEAKGVAGIVREYEESEKNGNLLVLGDFNAEPGAKSLSFYREVGLRDAVCRGDCEGDEHVTHESGRRIDRILANEGALEEVVQGFVLGTPARAEGHDWRTTPEPIGYASDHYPVVVDLKPGS